MSAIPVAPIMDFVRRKTLMAMYIWKRDNPVIPDKYKSHDKIIFEPHFIGINILYHNREEKETTRDCEWLFLDLYSVQRTITFLTVSFIGFYFTTSLSALPALNPGTFDAGITSSAPV